MRTFLFLTAVTLLHLLVADGTAESGIVVPVGAAPGTEISADLLPGVDPSVCTLLVLFDPDCPFCGELADAHRTTDIGLPAVWVTDDPRASGRFRLRLPQNAGLILSRALLRQLDVQAVPAGVWVFDGTVLSTRALRAGLSAAELAAGCTPETERERTTEATGVSTGDGSATTGAGGSEE